MPFKALFSPHEFMLAVSLASDRRYSVNQQADALDFLIWLLNTLHRDFLAIGSRIVADTFQGQVQVSSKRLKAHELAAGAADGNFDTKTVPFFYLSLDLPPVPLYQSPTGEYLVPQVPLQQLLVKYDGGQLTQRGDLMQAFSLEHLPEYLILHYRRFTKSHLVIEKNRTVVSHPMTGLPVQNCTAFLVSNCLARQETILYDIIANICHVGEAALGKGHFLVQLLHPANGHWIEIDDLNVKEIPALNVPLCESFIQVWRRQFK
jgi:U4/U6.U5 tri-snRNP-associated protein 2